MAAESKAEKQKKERYEKFVLAFRKNNGNATEAAIAAGYSVKNARNQGCAMLKKPYIQKRLEELAKDATRKAIITIEKRQEILSKIAVSDLAEASDRIRAIDVMNKMDGVYVVKVEATVSGNIAEKLKGRGKHGKG